jgi:PAS domain S-box-containing protein
MPTFPRPSHGQRLLLAGLLPMLAGGLEWWLWPVIQPHVWQTFLPAVFLSAWLGGLRGALLGTLVATSLAWFFFLPPQYSFVLHDVREAASITMFVAMGLLFGIFHERLRSANRRAADANFRPLFEQAAVGMAQVRLDGTFHRVNARLCAMTGFTEAELLAKNFQELTHPDDLNPCLNLVRQLIAGKINTFNQEQRYRRQDGSTLIANLTVALERDAAGRPVHLLSIIEDITEPAQNQKERREAEEKFTSMFNSSQVATSVSTVDEGRYLNVNDAWLKLFGRRREEVIGRTVFDLQVWLDLGQRDAMFAELKARGVITNFEMKLRAKDGGTMYLLWSGAPIMVGGKQCLLGAALDITERKRTEEALLASEKKFRESMDVSPVPMALHDDQLRVNYVNSALVKTFGYTLEDVPTLADWWPKAYPDPRYRQWVQDTWQAEIGRVRQTGESFVPVEVVVRCKDGTDKTILASAASLSDVFEGNHLVVLYDITARKQAEAALLNTNTLLREAQQLTNLGYWTWSPERAELFWSPEVYKIFGRDPELGPVEFAEVKNYFTSESQARLDVAVAAAFQRGEAYACDLEVVHRDGTRRWVTARGEAVFDPGGRQTGLRGTMQDVTDRKRTELALSENRRLLAQIIENSGALIFLKNQAGHYLLVNHQWEAVTGIKREAALGKTDSELFPGQDGDQFRANDLEVMRSGTTLEKEEVLELPNGARHFISIKFPTRNESGEVVGLCGMVTEITERKRTEESLVRLATAVDQAAEAIFITDTRGTILYANPAFEKISGYAIAEALGQNPRLLKSGKQDDAFYRQMWGTITRGEIWHGQFVNRHKNGKLFQEEATISPIRNAAGKVVNYVAVKRDVTHEKQLENQFRQAQKLEAIGTLAGGIAHDFNNILAAMFGFGYLLQQETAGNASAQENVGEILKAANRAKDLVQQILTFSRQREQKREIIRLDTVVKEAAKFLRASLPAQIHIELNLDADAPAVLADATQIYQVTMNLATNALHAMEGRSGSLTIQLEAFEPDAEFLVAHPGFHPRLCTRLTIRDDGCGMDAQTIERIFEPFFTTKPVGKGTGLGLAVVHGIVQAHEGIITVSSVVGRGTTFSLCFPAQAKAALPTDPETTELPLGRGETVLVVDDEPALTRMFERLLRRLNYQPRTCNSPREAIRQVRENPRGFALAITDLTMPEINGLEVSRQFRALRSDLPVLLMTGFNASLKEETLAEAGICKLLDKPVSLASLAETIHAALQSTPKFQSEAVRLNAISE